MVMEVLCGCCTKESHSGLYWTASALLALPILTVWGCCKRKAIQGCTEQHLYCWHCPSSLCGVVAKGKPFRAVLNSICTAGIAHPHCVGLLQKESHSRLYWTAAVLLALPILTVWGCCKRKTIHGCTLNSNCTARTAHPLCVVLFHCTQQFRVVHWTAYVLLVLPILKLCCVVALYMVVHWTASVLL
jgi:hypothetical protein